MSKAKMVILVEGGVVQAIRTNARDLDVEVFDIDNIRAEEGISTKEIDRRWNEAVEGLAEIDF